MPGKRTIGNQRKCGKRAVETEANRAYLTKAELAELRARMREREGTAGGPGRLRFGKGQREPEMVAIRRRLELVVAMKNGVAKISAREIRVLLGSLDAGQAAKPGTPPPPQMKKGSAGGKARAQALTPQRRKEIARRAIRARWEKRKQASMMQVSGAALMPGEEA